MSFKIALASPLIFGYKRNLDIALLEGVNVIYDLTNLPLSFDDNTFEYIGTLKCSI